MQKATTETFDQEVLKSPVPVLVEFYTTWCPACRAIAPVLEKVGQRTAGRARIVQVNVEEEMELGLRYAITAVPTLILFKDGEAVTEASGAPAAVLQHLTGLVA